MDRPLFRNGHDVLDNEWGNPSCCVLGLCPDRCGQAPIRRDILKGAGEEGRTGRSAQGRAPAVGRGHCVIGPDGRALRGGAVPERRRRGMQACRDPGAQACGTQGRPPGRMRGRYKHAEPRVRYTRAPAFPRGRAQGVTPAHMASHSQDGRRDRGVRDPHYLRDDVAR